MKTQKNLDAILQMIAQKRNMNTEAEISRLERMLEYHYTTDKKSETLHFIEYAYDFLKNNITDILNTDKYSSDFLDDVPNPKKSEFLIDDTRIQNELDDIFDVYFYQNQTQKRIKS